ncbi:MAG: cyclophilin-like fold protein [Candidatus Nitrosotenuis sp.]
MKHQILVKISTHSITLELDDSLAPKTVSAFLSKLPFSLKANIWGKEIYTDPAPFSVQTENAKGMVELFDVAFWPPGNAICLFYGPTLLGTKGQIKPYSPVNVIGKIMQPDDTILSKINDEKITFTKA